MSGIILPMKTLLLLALVCSTSNSTVTRTMSVYADSLHGQVMANGEVYNKNKMTVASNDFPLNSRVRVTFGEKSVVVRVTDRMARRFSGRRIDASRALWNHLTGNAASGLRTVKVKREE